MMVSMIQTLYGGSWSQSSDYPFIMYQRYDLVLMALWV
ncbi:hypothetical protein JCM18902_1029 [Psychrobacter sp. JCM 18902]|nr:hypothetical protein JCM18902_1029 [Psychrobacter sp. JCM 18902]